MVWKIIGKGIDVETIIGLVGIVVTLISIVVTVISILQAYERDKYEKSNRSR